VANKIGLSFYSLGGYKIEGLPAEAQKTTAMTRLNFRQPKH